MKKSKTITLVLKAVGIATGVAVVVINVLRVTSVETSITLLGIGVFALGLAALSRE
jgi:hypothetical protein